MKKHFVIFVIVFLVTIGFAAANTVLDITGNINVAENIEDFKIEITNLKINNNNKTYFVSKDKQSFTFTGSGNDTLEYTVTNYSYQYDANIVLTCTPSDNITVEQISNLPAQSKNSKGITSTSTSEITCTITVEKISRTDYAEDMCKYVEGTEWTFDYTGAKQEFIAPCDGNYKIEAWGAQGGNIYNKSGTNNYASIGNITKTGGYGGYSTGEISVDKDKTLHIYVGGAGGSSNLSVNRISGGYNGGGNGGSGYGSYNCFSGAGGGGVTHVDIGTKTGLLSELEDNKANIIIVSGGGGGALNHNYLSINGAHAGGYVGNAPTSIKPGRSPLSNANQNSGYKFGLGQTGKDYTQGDYDQSGSAGGGGGYYGGLANSSVQGSYNGGGGSSYIGNPLLTNKAMYCYSCAQSSEESTKTISTTCTSSTPTANCAKQGNGYAKITYLGK